MPGVVFAYSAAMVNVFQFTPCLTALMRYDAYNEQHIMGVLGGEIAMQSGPRIAEIRHQMVEKFLFNDLYANSEWLLMVDADMTFEPDLVSRLMEEADHDEVPILGGLAFAGGHAGGRAYPTIYEEYTDDDGDVGVRPVDDYPRNRLVKCGATGGGCLLVHRTVYQRMARPYPNGYATWKDGRKNPYPWFVEGQTDPKGRPLGEDVVFCRKARGMGIPTHVHTGVKLGHVKTYILNEEEWLRRQADGRIEVDNATRKRAERELAKL